MSLFDYVFGGAAPAPTPLAPITGSREQRERIEDLEKQVGELALLARALMVALEEKGAISHPRLREIMDKIDAEDGVVDGQVTSYRGQKKAATEKAKAKAKAAREAQKAVGGDGAKPPK